MIFLNVFKMRQCYRESNFATSIRVTRLFILIPRYHRSTALPGIQPKQTAGPQIGSLLRVGPHRGERACHKHSLTMIDIDVGHLERIMAGASTLLM